jgi:hypothetical protein
MKKDDKVGRWAVCSHSKLGKVMWIQDDYSPVYHGRSFSGAAWEARYPTFLSEELSYLLDEEVVK